MIDIGLGINSQAYAVLHMLKSWEGTLADEKGVDDIKTFAWYNGRERGISLVVSFYLPGGPRSTRHPNLVFAFSEHRCSDQIFVDQYEKMHAGVMKEPCHTDDEYELAYQNRTSFDEGYAGAVAQHIVKAIQKWLRAKVREESEVRTEAQVYGDDDGLAGAESGVEFEEI